MSERSKHTKKSQSQRFIDKARELGCDKNEAAFEAKLKIAATMRLTGKPEIKRKNPTR